MSDVGFSYSITRDALGRDGAAPGEATGEINRNGAPVVFFRRRRTTNAGRHKTNARAICSGNGSSSSVANESRYGRLNGPAVMQFSSEGGSKGEREHAARTLGELTL